MKNTECVCLASFRHELCTFPILSLSPFIPPSRKLLIAAQKLRSATNAKATVRDNRNTHRLREYQGLFWQRFVFY